MNKMRSCVASLLKMIIKGGAVSLFANTIPVSLLLIVAGFGGNVIQVFLQNFCDYFAIGISVNGTLGVITYSLLRYFDFLKIWVCVLIGTIFGFIIGYFWGHGLWHLFVPFGSCSGLSFLWVDKIFVRFKKTQMFGLVNN